MKKKKKVGEVYMIELDKSGIFFTTHYYVITKVEKRGEDILYSIRTLNEDTNTSSTKLYDWFWEGSFFNRESKLVPKLKAMLLLEGGKDEGENKELSTSSRIVEAGRGSRYVSLPSLPRSHKWERVHKRDK